MKYRHKLSGMIYDAAELEEIKPLVLDGQLLYPGDKVYVTCNITGVIKIMDVKELSLEDNNSWHANMIPAVIYSLRKINLCEAVRSIIKVLEND